MRSFDHASSAKSPIGLIDVARWEQYGLDGELPFRAMWYTVPPGESCPRDQHPEPELSLVMTGQATVETAEKLSTIEQGSAFLLDSEEAHTVHNRSSEPLLVFSAYWISSTAGGTDE